MLHESLISIFLKSRCYLRPVAGNFTPRADPVARIFLTSALSALICAVIEATNDAMVVERVVMDAWTAAIAAVLAAVAGSTVGPVAAPTTVALAVRAGVPVRAEVPLTEIGPASSGA